MRLDGPLELAQPLLGLGDPLSQGLQLRPRLVTARLDLFGGFSRRSDALTDRGQLLLELCQLVLARTDLVLEACKRLACALDGPVRVPEPSDIGAQLLARLLELGDSAFELLPLLLLRLQLDGKIDRDQHGQYGHTHQGANPGVL